MDYYEHLPFHLLAANYDERLLADLYFNFMSPPFLLTTHSCALPIIDSLSIKDTTCGPNAYNHVCIELSTKDASLLRHLCWSIIMYIVNELTARHVQEDNKNVDC